MSHSRAKEIKVRVNDAEYEEIKRRAAAAGLNVAVYIRTSAVGDKDLAATEAQAATRALLRDILDEVRELAHEIASHSTSVAEELLGQRRLVGIEAAVERLLADGKKGTHA